jgi:feruloyl esterase
MTRDIVTSRRFGPATLMGVAGCLLVATVTAASGTQDCSALSGLTLDGAKVTSVNAIAAGNYTQPDEGSGPHTFGDLPTFCEVRGIATPTPQSRIGFTVWLPQPAHWSHRLHMVGNGAYGSNLYYAQLVARIQRGDVAVATDTGHAGDTLGFGFDNPEAILDWVVGRSTNPFVRRKRLQRRSMGTRPPTATSAAAPPAAHRPCMRLNVTRMISMASSRAIRATIAPT